MGSRSTHADALLGPDGRERITSARVLMIGAGGIGCELLKNLVCTGFGYIEIIDLDTIDLSNLNRQFLFRKEHVKRPKAIVARDTATQFNPHVKIHALHGNIKDARYDVAYFKSFDIVLNALDNLDARRHVNKMCIAADKPLIESGTAGYRGQVEPIRKDITTCYDCLPKEVPKTFPICTIRSTPSTPIHCIVWAKSYLFPQLFGPDDETDAEALDKAAADGENVSEIEELKKEAAAMKEIRSSLGQPECVKRVFDKVFKQDVERLLKMDDMWRTRRRPTPISYAAMSTAAGHNGMAESSTTNGTIRDQRELSDRDSFDLFVQSFARLAQRLETGGTPLEWDKDDDDALDFATAASNLRAGIFGIPRKTRFDVKQMAGNIIPAIATTNAIVGGLIVLQAIRVLRDQWDKARTVWVSRLPERALSTLKPSPPEPHCAVCRTPYVNLPVDVEKLTIRELVTQVVQPLGYDPDAVSIVEGSRVLFDPDFDDNADRTLSQLRLGIGGMLTISDEDGDLSSSVLILAPYRLSSDTKVAVELPTNVPKIPRRPHPVAHAGESSRETSLPTLKRSAEAADFDNGIGPAGKRPRHAETTDNGSDGVIVLDDDQGMGNGDRSSVNGTNTEVIELD